MRWLSLLLLTSVAACQTEARRLLVVDLTLADPLTLEATAAPWHDAGYRVEYRRFYPHLTRLDLSRYRTVLVLGGREPEGLSDALTIGDLAILTEWIRRDGVVVLGYTEGDASKVGRFVLDARTPVSRSPAHVPPPRTMPASALSNADLNHIQMFDICSTQGRTCGDAVTAARARREKAGIRQ